MKDERSAVMTVRITPAQKSRWVYLSRRRGMKLEDWVAEHLDDAAGLEMAQELDSIAEKKA